MSKVYGCDGCDRYLNCPRHSPNALEGSWGKIRRERASRRASETALSDDMKRVYGYDSMQNDEDFWMQGFGIPWSKAVREALYICSRFETMRAPCDEIDFMAPIYKQCSDERARRAAL